jgi:hypothetical protein
MAIPISDVHDFIRTIIKKNRGGFVSPNDIDRAVNRGVSDWLSAVIYKFKRTGKFEFDHLLVKRATFSVAAGNYVQALPSDYIEGLTIYVINDGTLIEGTIYSWDEFLEVKNSKILTPDLSYPIATIYIDTAGAPKIEFAPIPISGTYTFTLVYMRKPAKAEYKYITTNGNITYVDTGSVNIDLDDRYFTDIVTRALMYIGISLKDNDIASIETLKDNNQKIDER